MEFVVLKKQGTNLQLFIKVLSGIWIGKFMPNHLYSITIPGGLAVNGMLNEERLPAMQTAFLIIPLKRRD